MTKFLYLILVSTLLFWANSFADDELLPAEQAFNLTAEVIDSNSILVTWEIAEGYYMYRDRMSFRFNGNNLISTRPDAPTGTRKKDPIFGDVEVYTQSVSIDLAVVLDNVSEFQLIATGQGCNEPVGVCYPPLEKTIQFTKASVSEPVASLTGNEILNSVVPLQSGSLESSSIESAEDLRSILAAGFEQQEFLDVEEAFKLNFEVISTSTLNANFAIADGYYLYKSKIEFNGNIPGAISQIGLPDGKTKVDEYFGEVTVFTEGFAVPISVADDMILDEDFALTAIYQGCAEDGICYSPVTKTFSFASLFVSDSGQNTPSDAPMFNSELINEQSLSGQSPVQSGYFNSTDSAALETAEFADKDTNSLTLLLLGALAAGLLLTFTPCVLPMIPILASIIAGQGQGLTKTRGGVLAIIYVLGTMITYAAMGALAGATGDQLQAYFQNIWAIGFLSLLFFIMALSMFGLFEFQMPGFIQSRIQSGTSTMKGSMPLVLVLGVFSALVVGACVSPVLISFLGIAVSTGDPALGAAMMVAMALGMGLPLIALGFGAGHIIPRAGPWMEKIKQAFGVLLVGVAIYLLGILPQIPVLLLWGCFFIILSLFLGKGEAVNSSWTRLEKGAGIILLVWGIVLLVGGFLGQRDILNPLPKNIVAQLTGSSSVTDPDSSHTFLQVTTSDQLDDVLQQAKLDNKPVMVDYYADWCVDCIRMEKTTFRDANVVSMLEEKFVSLQIDVTDPTNPENKLLKQRFSVFGPPATIFIDKTGNILSAHNFYGYMDADEFFELISRI